MKALSKRPRTTTWIWNLHDHAHVLIESGVDTVVYTRKVFSSNVAHLSLVFFWLGGIHFHGAYFSTYEAWLKDPKHSASGTCLFQLWRSEGLITHIQLKYASLAAIAGSILCITGSYVHMHTLSTVSYHKTFRSISIHHCLFVLGLGSFSWSAHQVHISLPANTLLDSGPVNPYVLDRQVSSKLVNLYLPDISILGSTGQVFNSSTTSVFLGQVSAHHVSVGCVSISVGLYLLGYNTYSSGLISSVRCSVWHSQLSINLAVIGSLSIVFANEMYAIPMYPYSICTVLYWFNHHMWIGGFLTLGAGAHASIAWLRFTNTGFQTSLLMSTRDVILGHLIWVSIALGFHSYSIYIHNDTLQSLGRPEDLFGDHSIQCKPFYTIISTLMLNENENKLVYRIEAYGTADEINL